MPDRPCPDEASGSIREGRSQDLLVYLALSRFGRRPAYGDLPPSIRLDVRAFFGSYAAARERADAALFSLGDATRLDEAYRSAPFGKLMPEALYVRVDDVDRLPTALRLYEGCARTYLGRVEGATIVRLERREPKASYLSYPDFDVDPRCPASRRNERPLRIGVRTQPGSASRRCGLARRLVTSSRSVTVGSNGPPYQSSMRRCSG